MVKMFIVLVSTISNSQIFFAEKNVSSKSYSQQKLLTFFSAKILVHMPYLMIKVLTIR